MTIEEKPLKDNKRAVIIGHRKRLELCILCGKNVHTDSCTEIYDRADNRSDTEKNHPIKYSKKVLDLKKKKDTIIIYRSKKLLCLRCGLEKHEGNNCIESYEMSDNRTLVEKEERPAIISTVKEKPLTIIEEIKQDKIQISKIDVTCKKTETIKLQRDFIVLNITPSSKGDIVDFSCISQLSKKYNNHIICVIGDLSKSLPFSDLLKLKKLSNIITLDKSNKQNIYNYLHSCDMFLSFKNEYTYYTAANRIKTYIFEDGKNATSFLKDTAYLTENK